MIPLLTRDLAATSTLSLPQGPAGPLPARILQFGEGNFLRGFADWMIDRLNSSGLFHGGVVVVQPVPQGMAAQVNAQDGLYTLILRGIQDGTMTEDRRVITAINQCIDPYQEWTQVVAAAVAPDLRFVVSNTTEAGIVYHPETYDGQSCPVSFPAKVAALLLERFKSSGGGAGSGWVFLPCELIEHNGSKLKEHVLRHAQDWGLGEEFITWVETENHFLNTLVDRIVPGFPRDEVARLREELGYEDNLIVAAEIFHLWVIEGPAHLAEELPFHKAGLNVIWTNDMTPYRSRKVRVLNGAHTATVPAAFLSGFDTVGEMMEDSGMGGIVRRVVFDEILPVLAMDDASRRGYAGDVLDRFRNPSIRHELLSITLNSVSKWKVRVLPSLRDQVAASGSLPPLLTFSLAALIRFYDGTPVSATELSGCRDGAPYPIRDDADVLARFSSAWGAYHRDHDLPALVHTILADPMLWGEDLAVIDGLPAAIATNLENILSQGTRTALLTLP